MGVIIVLLVFYIVVTMKKKVETSPQAFTDLPEFLKMNQEFKEFPELVKSMNKIWNDISEKDRKKYSEELVKNINKSIQSVCPVCPIYVPKKAKPLIVE
jgi:hypothetical protein